MSRQRSGCVLHRHRLLVKDLSQFWAATEHLPALPVTNCHKQDVFIWCIIATCCMRIVWWLHTLSWALCVCGRAFWSGCECLKLSLYWTFQIIDNDTDELDGDILTMNDDRLHSCRGTLITVFQWQRKYSYLCNAVKVRDRNWSFFIDIKAIINSA